MFTDLTNKISKSVLLFALKFYLLLAVPLIILVAVGHHLDRYFNYLDWQKNQSKFVSTIKVEVAGHFYEALSDLLVLADNHNLFAENIESNIELAKQFERHARISRSYHQLRFINTKGQEVVRVNFTGNDPDRVPEEQLQNKAHRSYFQSTITMKQNEVFVSRLDLNLEHRKIEQPLRPVIRFATPVYDNNGNKRGILILNYLGEKLLHILSNHDKNNESLLFLINEQGYFLYSKDESQTWGFQITGRPDFSDVFQDRKEIISSEAGNILRDNGLFTFDVVNQVDQMEKDWLRQYTPFAHVLINTEEKPWRIVSIVDNELLYASSNTRLHYVIIGLSIVLLSLVPVSLLWGRSRAHTEELLRRDHLYAQVVNQSNELTCLTDLDGVIQYINPAVENCTGYNRNELIGMTPRIFKSGRQTDGFYQDLWECLKEGKPFEGIFINKRKDGSLFYETKTIAPLHDTEGKPWMYVSTGKDITIKYNMLEQEMDTYDTIAGGISHHFGNLLSAISGFAHLILLKSEDDKNSSVSRYVSKIIVSSKKAEKLLGDIRLISCVSPNSLQVINLYAPLQRTVEMWREEVPAQLALTTSLIQNIPQVNGNKESIMIVVRILLDNAKIEINDDGQIEVGLKTNRINNEACVTCDEPLHGEYVEIYVSDSGKGIPPEIQGRIWDPFFSTKETANLVGVTPGLGLSAVRAIMHKNEGHILLNTSNEHGTTIRLLFPVIEN